MRLVSVLLVVAATAICVVSAAASERAGPRSNRCADVYWRTGRDGDQRCPTAHSVLADISYVDLRWTVWRRHRASGHGDELGFDDAPGPRPGSIVQAITVKLSAARRCSDGRTIYTHITTTLYATRRIIGLNASVPLMPAKGRVQGRFSQSYACHPQRGGVG